MTFEITRDEFDRLQSRVEVLEGEVEGEKLVTRHILDQTRRNGDDLAAIKTRMGRVEGRLDGVEGRLDAVEARLGRVEGELQGLRKDLPKLVGDVVREVFRERDRER